MKCIGSFKQSADYFSILRYNRLQKKIKRVSCGYIYVKALQKFKILFLRIIKGQEFFIPYHRIFHLQLRSVFLRCLFRTFRNRTSTFHTCLGKSPDLMNTPRPLENTIVHQKLHSHRCNQSSNQQGLWTIHNTEGWLGWMQPCNCYQLKGKIRK